jgi:DNA invertase Pin-like site-specific DNA recombinase
LTIAACKKQKAKLIVAKLDRLSRNVAFLLKLTDSGLEVLFADLPELNGAMGKFVLITMANVAELESGLISERTRAALKAAKARGVKLGRHGAEVLAPKFKEEARQRAMELEPVITELKGKGLSLAKMAAELNKRKVATPRRGRWDHSSVQNVLNRLAARREQGRLRTHSGLWQAVHTRHKYAVSAILQRGIHISTFIGSAPLKNCRNRVNKREEPCTS